MKGRLAAALAVLVPATASATSVEIVDYYAGKDELCLSRGNRELDGRLRRLILVTDFYGSGDRETSCTLVIETSDGGFHRVSASSGRCHTLDANSADEYRFKIAGDHLCDFRKVK